MTVLLLVPPRFIKENTPDEWRLAICSDVVLFTAIEAKEYVENKTKLREIKL